MATADEQAKAYATDIQKAYLACPARRMRGLGHLNAFLIMFEGLDNFTRVKWDKPHINNIMDDAPASNIHMIYER